PFVDAVSAIPGIVHQYMTQQMTEAIREAVQIPIDRLQDSLQRENDEFLRNIKENMKKVIKGKDPPLDQTGGLKDKKKDVSMHQLALHLKQQPGVQAELPQGLNLDKCLSNKTLPAAQGNTQSWISDLARQTDARSSFNELLDTPIDFSNFIMNRLNVDTLTPELLAGNTYELMRGSCNSLTELEYHLEEVYKATTDQLDWVNPEGQQYPHDLLQPLPLIPDNRGRRVIPFDHFINNDLEYLREEPINYDRNALWGVSHWGRKRKLSNLTVEDCFAFNVSLRMFTSSTVIKRRVEDLQLGVESYQKKLNLTKSDTDGMLNDVRNALDDRLKGIRMQYLPTTIWRRGDKDRATAMILAIEKMLKRRRIMRSLEKFVGGQLYEGDFRMLQRTI
nr:hypothetical protein [Tanacetum cinerariifolium]